MAVIICDACNEIKHDDYFEGKVCNDCLDKLKEIRDNYYLTKVQKENKIAHVKKQIEETLENYSEGMAESTFNEMMHIIEAILKANL